MATKGMSVYTHQGEDYTINDPNNAAEFSSSTAYEKGDYCYYQGTLKRFTEDHPAGAWNGNHAVTALLANELKGIKTTIDENGMWEDIEWEDGKQVPIGTSTNIDVASRSEATGWRCAVIACKRNDCFNISVKGGTSPRSFCFTDASGNVLMKGSDQETLTNAFLIAPMNAAYFVVNDNYAQGGIKDSYKYRYIIDDFYNTKGAGVNSVIREISSFTNGETVDSFNYIRLSINEYNNFTLVKNLLKKEITENGKYELYFISDAQAFNKISIKHSGQTVDIPIIEESTAASEKEIPYKLTFTVTGHNPSASNGMVLTNIRLDKNEPMSITRISQETEKNTKAIEDYFLNKGAAESEKVKDIASVTNGATTDLMDYIRLSLMERNNGSDVATIFRNVFIKENGTYEYFFTTDDETFDQLWLKHSGSTIDIKIFDYSTSAKRKTYKLTFTVTGHNPSANNGLTLTDLKLFENTPMDMVTVTKKINELEKEEEAGDDLMIKYREYVNTLDQKVKGEADDKTLLFALITDTHHTESNKKNNNMEMVEGIADLIGVDFVAHLGDMITEGSSAEDNEARLWACMKSVKEHRTPFLYALGHHEMYPWLGDNNYTYERKYVMGIVDRYNKHIQENRGGELNTNIYYDFDTYKVRAIFVDSVYKKWGFTTDTITWLESVLGSVPAGYKVILFSHVPSRADANYGAYEPENGAAFEAAVNSFITGGGTVLCHIHGHTHWDNIVKDNDMSYPLISVCCALPNKTTIDEGISGNPTVYDRYTGTYSEFCFDIFCVHIDSGIVNMYRFGAGNDRTYPTE